MQRETSWEYRMPGECSATVRVEAATDASVEYELSASGVGAVDLDGAGEGVRVDAVSNPIDGGLGLRVRCRVDSSARIPRLRLRIGDESVHVRLLRPQVLGGCVDVLDGDDDAIPALVGAFDDPAEIPFACGTALGIGQFVRLLDRLSSEHRWASSRLHATRYGLVRGATLARTGFSVQSAAEFERLVEGLDELDGIGPVRPVEALGDVVAAGPLSPDELLSSLEFDRREIERRRDGSFFLVRLAHRVLADGVEAARGLALNRRWRVDGNYERQKAVAENAEHGERGASWRRLLCSAAREPGDEFRYALANGCYWTAEEARTDGQSTQLLYAAATELAADMGIEYITYRGSIERRLERGHRLRSHGYYGLAEVQFDRAVAAAAGRDDYLEATSRESRAITVANQTKETNDYESGISTLETAMERVLGLDVTDDYGTYLMQVLLSNKRELEGLRARSKGRNDRARERFEETVDILDSLGFDRSRERVESYLDRLDASTPSGSGSSDDSATADAPKTRAPSKSAASSDRTGDEPISRDAPPRPSNRRKRPGTSPDERETVGSGFEHIEMDDDSPQGLHRHGESRRLDETGG